MSVSGDGDDDDGSFVLVNNMQQDGSDSDMAMVDTPSDSAMVAQLAPYFASIGDPSAWNWSVAKTRRVEQQRQHAPDGALFVDELLALIGIKGQCAVTVVLNTTLWRCLSLLNTMPTPQDPACTRRLLPARSTNCCTAC